MATEWSRDLAARVAALEAELAALRGAHANLETLIENVPDYVVRLSPDGVFEYVNQYAPGLTPADVLGHQVYEFTAPSSHARIRATIAHVLATGEPASYETIGPGRTGPARSYFTRIAPIRAGDRIVALSAVSTDVTEVKETTRRLEDHEQRLALAAAAADLGYWHWDARADVVRWDATSCRHFGLPAEPLTTTYQGFLDRVHPADRARIREEVDAAIAGGHYAGLQFRVETPAGAVRWLMTAGRVERDPGGSVSGLLGCLFDLTERRRLEEQLVQAQRMDAVGQLAAGVAHNFNNLLAALIPTLELTARQAPASAPLLRDLQAAARRSADVVRQLTAFAGGGARGAAGPADVVEIARRVVELSRNVLDRAITVQLRAPASPLLAAIDGGELEQALVNLVLNARDALEVNVAAGRPARIEVEVDRARDPAPRIRIRVTDTGAGMSDEVRRRAIEPFFTTKPPGRGTGLGLSSAYATVTACGGQLELASTDACGTTVTLHLREVDAPAAEPPAPAPVAGGQGETVLLVDDEPTVRRTIAAVLALEGYQVRDFGDPREALAAFTADPAGFDVAIVDHSMPGLSGQALLDRMRAVAPGVRAISFSGNDLPLHGARARITKPMTVDALLATVRRVLDEP